MQFFKLTVFIVSLVAIAALGKYFYPNWESGEISRDNKEQTAEINQATIQMATKYDDSLRTTLTDFAAQYREADATTRRSLATSMQQKLLKLTVPVERKDIHLELVLSADQMAKGEASGEERFSQAIKANSWIGPINIL